MKTSLLKTFVWAQIWRDDNGQDLIEYALVVALIAFGATVGMGNVATGINSAFTVIVGKLSGAMVTT